MPKRRFTKEVLDEILQRDGATLIGEYDTFNSRVRILFNCQCGLQCSKVFQQIADVSGAKCIRCQTGTLRYDNTLLKKVIIESNAVLVESYETLNRDTLIKFVCECGVSYIKPFRSLVERCGAKCDTCTISSALNKRDSTMRELYGSKVPLHNPDIIAKKNNTNQEKYGGNTPASSMRVRQKMTNTLVERYGVEHPNQHPDILAKAQQPSWKYFKMPSGEIRKVQGYEPFALTDLLKVYTEEQIKTERKDVPRIEYETDGKKKYHFPDIFIPHENKIVEVKSTWTYKCKTDNILLKKKTAEEQGFLYEIWCYDGKGVRINNY